MSSAATTQHVSLQLAKRLDKYIPIPNHKSWRICDKDVLIRGRVLSSIRSKSPFFALPDHISPLKTRSMSVTSHGFMIIWETADTGFMINLKTAINVFCTADRFVNKAKKLDHFRCHIKIRLPRGNIHMFIRDEDVHKWTCAIMRGSTKSSMPTTFDNDEEILMTAMEDSGDFEEMTPTEYSECSESYRDDDDVEYDEYEDEEEEDESTILNTVIEKPPSKAPQNGTSVRSLCLKLENELKMKPKEQVIAEQQLKSQRNEKPQFVSELFCSPRAIFSDETVVVLEPTGEMEKKEQMKEVEREKQWWNRSLRC